MFTGIITDTGTITGITHPGDTRVTLACHYDMETISLGDSISCDGACLTVVEKRAKEFSCDVSQETLNNTTLGNWQKGETINLEQALRAGSPLGGHFVTGHVDATATLIEREISGDSLALVFELPPQLSCFVAKKGSITINGVSLTVNGVEESRFMVNIIPHTQMHTNLESLQLGDKVNLEVDIIARYLARNLDISRHADSHSNST